jgi:hypothetical protein
MSITHQTIRCLLLGAVAAALASCSQPDTVYVHHHYHSSDSGSALPGAPIHISDQGAPESYRVEGPAQ